MPVFMVKQTSNGRYDGRSVFKEVGGTTDAFPKAVLGLVIFSAYAFWHLYKWPGKAHKQ